MANELTLQITQDVGKIGWNFEEINKELDTKLAKYKNWAVTEDELKTAKDEKAKLNKLKDAIENRRREIKDEFCAPYDVFASEVKVVVDKITKTYDSINTQVKAFEDAEKNAKKERIASYWDMLGTEPKIDFELVFDKKFLRKDCKESEWTAILEQKHEQIKRDLDTIAGFEADKRNHVLANYMRTIDLEGSLGKWGVYQEQMRQAEEFRRRAEEQAKKAVNLNTGARISPNTAQKPEEQAKTQRPTEQAENAVYERVVRVWGTKEQIIMLAGFMNQQHIRFEKVEVR